MAQTSNYTSEILYKRLLHFAQECQILISKLPKNIYNIEYGAQLIRSSASPGANYIEAVEASSRKDFIHRLKICRKEVKESIHWLTLIKFANTQTQKAFSGINELIREGHELIKIFTSSILTSERNLKIRK